MRAILCKAWGEPSTLAFEAVPPPALRPGHVRIAVHAVGVNFADTLIIAGKYQEKPPLPFSPGLEAAGIVTEVASDVRGCKTGDRVMAFATWGAYAEEMVVPASAVFRIPDKMELTTAAAFPVAYGTSHLGLLHRGQLKASETLLVHGAAGGVGLTAVEIGRALGATVIATAGSPDKVKVALQHGAHYGIDYSKEDIRERVKALTGGKGADVIYDPVGGDVFDASLRCINWEGRILVVGFASGRIPQAPCNYVLVKNCAVIGVLWGATARRDPALVGRSFEALFRWYDEGKLRPLVSRTMPLDKAAEALTLMMQRKITGKLVLTTGRA
ncbi:MAG TPA: NADPH:quinone oxidoreductase family protein [Alphaproteobacteria bacterium]|nr:NADPH:quinone oxidoreductase family protein [Alphaproteobacteria bacterium]